METIDHLRNLPALTAGAIHIWGVHVPGEAARIGALEAVLCGAERQRAQRFRRAADRQASIAARGALRILLAGYSGIPAAALEFGYSATGKPHAADAGVAFNVSHSGDWVVLAFGRNRQVGVDIEKIRRDVEVQAIAGRYFSVEEQSALGAAPDAYAAFFQLWAKKEAYVKASGSTLFRELGRCSVPVADGERDGWHFRRLEAGSGYAAAVATDRPLEALPCYAFGGLEFP